MDFDCVAGQVLIQRTGGNGLLISRGQQRRSSRPQTIDCGAGE